MILYHLLISEVRMERFRATGYRMASGQGRSKLAVFRSDKQMSFAESEAARTAMLGWASY